MRKVAWHLVVPCLPGGGGIAFINSAGNIAGYVAPRMAGLLRDVTGGYEVPMLVMGVLVLIAGVMVPVAARAAETRRSRRAPAKMK